MGKKVEIKVTTRGVGETNKAIARIGTKFERLKRDVFGAGSALGKLRGSMGKFASAVGPLGIALGAGGIGAAMAKSVSEFVKFEDALLDLQKVMGAGEGSAKQFTVAVDELAVKYGVASSSVLQGVANFKQAGFRIKESFGLQKAALDLVIAGDLEAAEASELLVSALKGFKAPASEATRLIDIMNEVSNKYATDLKELGTGMATIAPIANMMGFSFEETAGVLTPVIEVFRSGNEAAIALKTGLLRLVSDQKPVQEALAALGISQKDVNGELRSGKDILNDVAGAFVGLSEEQKIYFTSQLVGIQQAGRMVEVFNGLSKSTEITKTALNSAGSAAVEVGLRLDSTGKNIDRFKTAFNNLARDIGEAFSPALLASMEGFRQIFEDLKASGAIDSMAQSIRVLVPIMSDLAIGINKVLKVGKFLAKEVIDPLVGSYKLLQTLRIIPRFHTEEIKKDAQEIQKVVDKTNKALKSVPTGTQDKPSSLSPKTPIPTQPSPSKLNLDLWKSFANKKDKLTLSSKEYAIKQFTEEFGKYEELVKQGRITQDEYNALRLQGIEDIAKGFETVGSTAEATLTDMERSMKDVSQSMKGELTDFLHEGQFTFESLRKSAVNIASVIKRKFAEKAADDIFALFSNKGVTKGNQAVEQFAQDFNQKTKRMFETFIEDKHEMDRQFEDNLRGLGNFVGNTADGMRANMANGFFKPTGNAFTRLAGHARSSMANMADSVGSLQGVMGGVMGGGGGQKKEEPSTFSKIAGIAMKVLPFILHDGGPVKNAPRMKLPSFHTGGEVAAILRNDEYVVSPQGTKAAGINRLNKINKGDMSDFGGGGGRGVNITVMAPITLNAIDAQSGVAFLSQPENIEVFESAIRQALAENGGRDLGL